MEFIKKNKNKIVVFLFLFVIVLGIIILLNSGNSGITTVYYRTFSENKGWSKWSKNGKTSGNLKDNITNIQVKVEKKVNGEARYRVYSVDNNWSDEYGSNAEIENQNITGIKFGLSGTLKKTSDICYRTYNDANKWLGWSCDGNISGNISQSIKAIEIKIVPKNIVLNEYLKDYRTIDDKYIGF